MSRERPEARNHRCSHHSGVVSPEADSTPATVRALAPGGTVTSTMAPACGAKPSGRFSQTTTVAPANTTSATATASNHFKVLNTDTRPRRQ